MGLLMTKISENTTVSIGLAILIVGSLVAIVWGASALYSQVQAHEIKLEEVKSIDNRLNAIELDLGIIRAKMGVPRDESKNSKNNKKF